MHEFSIALSIVDIAADTAEKNHLSAVHEVEVEIGQMSGVIPEALEFAWESARVNTLVAKAALKIRLVELEVRCRACGHCHKPDGLYTSCPGCGEVQPDILSGKELRVISITA
jgi:hydrogenase nickel incorporation protein HypA/HybF